MKTKLPLLPLPPSPLRRIRPVAWFWKAVDWWGRHQKFWWLLVALITIAWLAYDVGRVTTRADLVRMGGRPQGTLTVAEAEKRAQELGGGRLLITSSQIARFIDASGKVWEIPEFGSTVSKGAVERLRAAQVTVDGGISIELNPVKTSPSDILASTFFDVIIKLGFIGIYAFLIFFVLRYLSNSNRHRFKVVDGVNKPNVKIEDVAGHEGPKREVLEIVDYLRHPERFSNLGARPPRGVLMYGPPGNGKTLLAKAIAGDADAHFIEQSASSFVQVYAGEGAKAVRQLFDQARKSLPCVVFIDEIDALGASRSAGGHDERIQTLNALLTEMGGFNDTEGLVVIAATNRLDVLDEALVRDGRFDRKVHVPLPSRQDRLQILQVHASKLPHMSANLELWANQTPGFSGASLANLVNEAAIEAVRNHATTVSDREFAAARDRVMIGVKDVSRRPSDRDRRFVAFHELGHALMRMSVGGRVEKVSIEPRGLSLGVTLTAVEDVESSLKTEEEFRQEVLVLMGGRAAEQVFCSAITNGASDDMLKASELARMALLRYGFNGRGPYVPKSEGLIKEMEEQAREWVLTAYEEAVSIMQQHTESMKSLAMELLAKEELSGEALATLTKADSP